MKIGVLADIHGNAPALRAVLAALSGRVEKILFLGDVAGYYPFLNECLDLWDPDGMTGVLGNHDKVLLDCLQSGSPPPPAYTQKYGSALERSRRGLSERAKKILRSWPSSRIFETAGKKIGMYHGAPWDPLEGRIYPDFESWERFESSPEDVILLGQTHYPMVKQWNNKTILNPGSVGQARDGVRGACYAELSLPECRAEHFRVSFDATTLIRDAKKHDPENKYLIEVLTQ